MEIEYNNDMRDELIKCYTMKKEICKANKVTYYTLRIIKDALNVWEYEDIETLDSAEAENYLEILRHILNEDEYLIMRDLMSDED